MPTTPLLFIGGPKDGKMISVHEGRNYYEATELRAVSLMSEHNANPHNRLLYDIITYKRATLQVTESKRVDVMYYDERGTPLIKYLLDSYADSR